jgi:hypothetical protein
LEAWTKFLKVLQGLSVSVLVCLTGAGLLILYAPPIEGLDLSAARKWPWIAVATVLVIALSMAKVADLLTSRFTGWRAERPRAALKFTWQSAANLAWWSCSRQQDGSDVTQLVADLNAFNLTDEYVNVVAARLIKPRVNREAEMPPVFVVSHPGGRVDNSRDYPVRARSNAHVRLVMMVRKRLGKPSEHLWVIVGLTEQNGYEHRLRMRLWPIPVAAGNPKVAA